MKALFVLWIFGVIQSLLFGMSVPSPTTPQVYALSQPAEENTDMKIVRAIFGRYDWRIRPKGLTRLAMDNRSGGPVIITTNLYLRTISKIDDVNMEYSAQFTFREMWNDARLAYGSLLNWTAADPAPSFVLLVPDDPSQRIWMPDTFFQNEKNAQRHMIDKPNVLIRIYANGDILYSVRLSLTLSCPMSLREYPMDRQTCYIDLASYAYTTEDILYEWKNESPIQLKDTVKSSLPSFDLIGSETGYCTSKTTTGEYSCLRVALHFQRMFSYYLLQLYIPSFMLVIVSWVSFWVDKSSVPARVTLGVTTLLTITTQASGINAKLPPVSYTKAIDIWIGVCLAFIFGALIEYALVNYAGNEMNRKHMRMKTKEVASIHSAPISHRSDQPIIRHNNGPQSLASMIPNAKFDDPHPINPSLSAKSMKFPKHPSVSSFGGPCRQWFDHECHSDMLALTIVPIETPVIMRRTNRKGPTICTRIRRWIVALYRDADQSKKIDVMSRILFPVGFLIFNCIYWYLY